MTLEQIAEVRTFLRSKGLSDDAIDAAVGSITSHEDTARPGGTVDGAREVNSEELNMGPDTTENINEVVDGEGQYRIHPNDTIRDPREDGEWLYDPKTYEKIRRAATGFTAERQTNFPGAERGEEWLRKEADKEIEESNKNVSHPADYYQYGRILERMDDTHRKKNSDYGDAAYKGYKKYGDFYFMVQLHNKFSRLESLTINNKTQMVKDESIDDTLLDMANYAIMFLESRHRKD